MQHVSTAPQGMEQNATQSECVELNLKGFTCPTPMLKTRRALMTMQGKKVLKVVTTDKGSIKYITILCQIYGFYIVEQEEDGNVFTFVIEHK